MPDFSDKKGCDRVINQYLNGQTSLISEDWLWEQFKYSLKHSNRYFFSHPLLKLLKSLFSKHTVTIDEGTAMYRARLDEDNSNVWSEYSRFKNFPEQIEKAKSKKGFEKTVQTMQKQLGEYMCNKNSQLDAKRIELGYQGYDQTGSGAPPPEVTRAGRCNLDGVPYLYTAKEEHTAVAEIRPQINDAFSVALLQPKHDIILVDFSYEDEDISINEDIIFDNIRRVFSHVHKEQSDDYLITQYISLFIQSLGYDGLCFNSSLVRNGTNYTLFRAEDYEVISSKLCHLSKVVYNFGQFN